MFLWCVNAAPDATVISIDLPNGIHGGGYPYWKTFLYRSFALRQQQVLLFRGDSHSAEMLARLKEMLADCWRLRGDWWMPRRFFRLRFGRWVDVHRLLKFGVKIDAAKKP